METKGSVALGRQGNENEMHREQEKSVWEGTLHYEIFYAARGTDMKTKGKKLHCNTGVKAEEITVTFLWIITFIPTLNTNRTCPHSLSHKVVDQLSMSCHWLRQRFKRSRFCSGKHKEVIAKSFPNQPNVCSGLGFLECPKQRSTSLCCDIVMSLFSAL